MARELGGLTCVAIGLTTIVGSGIFALPPLLAAGLGPLSFLAFVGAAVLVSLIGLMTAEAAGTTDRHGGTYQYVAMAFGKVPGFGVAWLSWVNNMLSWATVSLALVKLAEVAAPGLGEGHTPQLLATVEIVAFGVLNAMGVRPGAAVSNVLTVGKLVPLFLFVVIGFLAFQPDSFAGSGERLAAASASTFAVAVYRCIFAAGGFENVGVIAGDVKDPQRVIPRAVLLAIAASTVLYALVQIAAVSSVPELATLAPDGKPGSLALPLAGERAATQLGDAAFGAVIYGIILTGAVVSMVGYCAGVAIVAPRYLFALAEDGFVPAGMVKRDRRGTPVVAVLVVVSVVLLGGCPGGDDADPRPDAAPVEARCAAAVPGAPPPFCTCRGRAFTPASDQDWRHTVMTPIVTSAGAANHSSQDQISDLDVTVDVGGKFAYGLASVDLEDEFVRVWIDDCAGWRELGDFLTSADGRIAVPVAPSVIARPGVYEVRFQVLGDQTLTSSFVWLLPRGTRIALSDIDGTLTSSDAQLFQQILDGSHVPVAYPGAVDLTTAHATNGHVVLYLTGRPYYLTQRSRDWLDDLAFAPGPLHVTNSNSEAVPAESGVGDFKKAYVTSLLDAGYLIDVAYGNATTDIYAYLGAGLPADRVWIIGSNGGAQGTHAVADSWTARVLEVQASPAVTQPFAW